MCVKSLIQKTHAFYPHRMWDLRSGHCLKVVHQFGETDSDSQLLSCAFCPVNNVLAVGMYDGTLFVAEIC